MNVFRPKWTDLDRAIFQNLLSIDDVDSKAVNEAKEKIEKVKDKSQIIVSHKSSIHGHCWKDAKIDGWF